MNCILKFGQTPHLMLSSCCMGTFLYNIQRNCRGFGTSLLLPIWIHNNECQLIQNRYLTQSFKQSYDMREDEDRLHVILRTLYRVMIFPKKHECPHPVASKRQKSLPLITAKCSAVALSIHTFGMFTFAPFSIKSSAMVILPLFTAICNAVFPDSNGSFTSY